MDTEASVGEEPVSHIDRQAWLDAVVAIDAPAPVVLAAVGRELARSAPVAERIGRLLDTEPIATSLLPPLPVGSGPALLGQVHEVLAAGVDQRARGAWYTPEPVARALVDAALGALGPGPRRVCDPAVGGGVFLVAVADHQEARGVDPADIVTGLHGADIDPLAVRVARAVVALWAAGRGLEAVTAQIVCTDTLVDRPPGWARASFDAVVGNPPFLGQLAADTARTRDRAEALAERLGLDIPAYVDDSALFLLLGADLVADGGHLVLIQPQSVLASRDAGPIRAALARRLNLAGLWMTPEEVFGTAAVRVCAPILIRGTDVTRIEVWNGNPPSRSGTAPLPSDPSRWVEVAACVEGIPSVEAPTGPTVGTVSRVVAGFRDEYYGLVPGAREDTGHPGHRRLVTSGQIDPGRLAIGHRGVRFAKQKWRCPVVDPDRVTDPRARAWLETTWGPKVLVASQTRVIEAVVDPVGDLLPSTPVVAIMPDTWTAHELAAVVSSPWATAWLVGGSVGTGMTHDAVRVSAGRLAELPLPRDRGALVGTRDPLARINRATTEHEWRTALLDLAEATNRAYDLEAGEGEALTQWWMARLPAFRSDRP